MREASKLKKKPKKKESNDKGFQRFFNATKKSNKNKSNNNNNTNFNNNSNRLTVSESQLTKTTLADPFDNMEVVKETSSKLENKEKRMKTTSKHLILEPLKDLCEIRKRFPDFLGIHFADAMLLVSYEKSEHEHSILIEFDSVTNISQYTLRDIRVIFELFYKRKKLNEKELSLRIDELLPKNSTKFSYKLKKRLAKYVDVKLLKLRITLVGEIVGLDEPSLTLDNQILGGAFIEVKDYI